MTQEEYTRKSNYELEWFDSAETKAFMEHLFNVGVDFRLNCGIGGKRSITITNVSRKEIFDMIILPSAIGVYHEPSYKEIK